MKSEDLMGDQARFWAEKAEEFTWKERWSKVCDWDFSIPKIRWFEGGKLNITENCIDRHLRQNASKTAIIWEPNDVNNSPRKISYGELYAEVCRMTNVLKKYGVKKGDKICIYMPMIPELLFAMLACARLGAVHSVVFAGFSAESLAERVKNCGAKLLIMADGCVRGEKRMNFAPNIEFCLENTEVEAVLIWRNMGDKIPLKERCCWLNEELSGAQTHCDAERTDAEDELFILYTSGSTGKPKGIVHTVAGYMVYVWYSFLSVFKPKNDAVHFCTADAGWITGHSYLLYAPLLCGITTVVFEGVPTYPSPSRYWEIIEKYGVNSFYTSPTAIRSLMIFGEENPLRFPMNSLEVIGSVGEPINEEAWHWFHKNVGKGRCPLMDTWWQTETGGIMIAPLQDAIEKPKPSFASLPLRGVLPVLLDDNGAEITQAGKLGNLCFKAPIPSMFRAVYGDDARYKAYFSRFSGLYSAEDEAFFDEKGHFRILGRADDVIKVSGHRLGSAELEDAVNEVTGVFESAVIGVPHEIKGEAIYVFAVTPPNEGSDGVLKQRVEENLVKKIGAIARPERVFSVSDLPKTRSGKIMRRILRKIVLNDAEMGDLTTLLNPNIVNILKNRLQIKIE